MAYEWNAQAMTDIGHGFGFDPEQPAMRQFLEALIRQPVERLITTDRGLIEWGNVIIPVICWIRHIEVIDVSR
jgi:hypothetical protein